MNRREFVAGVATLPLFLVPRIGHALEVPVAIKDAKAQFYNFLLELAQGPGIAATQRLVLNSTIVPLDIAADTPYYNEELFRLHADRTFSGAIENIQPSTAVFMAARFSSQYRSLLDIAAAKIDQTHPEIQNSLTELMGQQTTATIKLTEKNLEFEENWRKIAEARKLDPESKDPKIAYEYQLQRITWFAQARYADQIQTYSDNLDRINSQIEAVRRRVYTAAEMSVLDNVSVLSKSYNIARPWNANTERSARAQGFPLSDTLLADVTKLPPAIYDSSPLVLPVGDLVAFLSAVGSRGFDTTTQSTSLDAGTRSWVGSGGGSIFGISLGGGGSGSSSFSKSVSKISGLEVSFANVGEYLADRSAWFNPAVLQDTNVQKLVKGRRELDNLQYVAVSLILVRGLKMKLRFSEAINTSDWSQSSFNAGGGANFFGFSIGGRGGSASSSTSIKIDDSKTGVTFEDGPNVVRVLGARVEPFIERKSLTPFALNEDAKKNPSVLRSFSNLRRGEGTYIDYQKAKINAIIPEK